MQLIDESNKLQRPDVLGGDLKCGSIPAKAFGIKSQQFVRANLGPEHFSHDDAVTENAVAVSAVYCATTNMSLL